MVKDVRRCSARRARRIRGFAPHRSRNIYMDYVSTVQKDKCRCYRLREIDKIKRSTNNSSTNNFVSRSVIKAGTLGIYQVVPDEGCFYHSGMDYYSFFAHAKDITIC